MIITRVPDQKTNNPVSDYFSAVAPGYEAAARNWPWSVIRNREARAIEQAIGDVHGADALDLGCGTGYYTQLLLVRGARHVTAVDLSEAMLNNLPAAAVTPIQGSADKFDSNLVFDIICAAGLIEFVESPINLLANSRRLISKDGRFVLLGPRQSPLSALYRMFHARHGIDISLFTEHDFLQLSSETGWRLVSIRAIFPFSFVATLEPMP